MDDAPANRQQPRTVALGAPNLRLGRMASTDPGSSMDEFKAGGPPFRSLPLRSQNVVFPYVHGLPELLGMT
jgi:hypothetical protein